MEHIYYKLSKVKEQSAGSEWSLTGGCDRNKRQQCSRAIKKETSTEPHQDCHPRAALPSQEWQQTTLRGEDFTEMVQPSHSANKQVNYNDNRPQREGISNPQLPYHLKCSVFIKHYSNYAKKLESTNQTKKAGNRTSLRRATGSGNRQSLPISCCNCAQNTKGTMHKERDDDKVLSNKLLIKP